MNGPDASPAPSDRLRPVYEHRAELEYPEPIPDATRNRKFEFVWGAVRAALPCEAFLDAGCGDGRYLAALAGVEPRPGRIAGTDIAERILTTARTTAARAGIKPELAQANLETLPFDAGSFDLVLCSQVIEHLLDVDRGLRELARVLRPGGRLVLSTDNAANTVSRVLNGPRRIAVTALGLTRRRLRVHFPHADFQPAELRRRLEAAGLAVERLDSARFHLDGAPGRSRGLQELLDRIDRAVAPHLRGDILLAVCTR